MKQLKILLLTSMVMIFTACGGGGSSPDTTVLNNETPQTIAIDKIKLYAGDNTQPIPTIEDYQDAGVVGVTPENIDDVNSAVVSLTAIDVDTAEKIQKLVDDLAINILPTANAGPDKEIELNKADTITGSGTDIDGVIVSYVWSKGTDVLATTASFDYTPTTEGADTLTLTVMDDDGATASDSMNVVVSGTPRVIHNVSTTAEFRQALLDAESNGEDDTIVLADGTYKTTDDGKGTFTFLTNTNNSLYITGAPESNITISGDNTEQVLNIYAANQINVTIENLTIQDGNTSSGLGGGLYTNTNTILTRVSITSNYALLGAGVFADDTPIIINDSNITDNHALNGGGGIRINSRLDINNSIVSGNTATYRGGGISSGFRAKISMSNSTISYNTAGDFYGAFNDYGGTFIENTKIQNNTAQDIGGFGVESNSIIKNSIVSNNYSGSLSSEQTILMSQNAQVINTLFVDNDKGLSLYEGDVYIVNSSFFNNGTNEIFELQNSQGSNVYIDNTFVDNSKISVRALFDNNLIYSSDPGFVNQTLYDYHLLSHSIMIDSGVNTLNAVEIPITDLDGNSRPIGSSTDIGPYEYQ